MRSGRSRSISLTPATKMNSESCALYTGGTGMPTRASIFSMPFSAKVIWSAFSDEKQIPVI